MNIHCTEPGQRQPQVQYTQGQCEGWTSAHVSAQADSRLKQMRHREGCAANVLSTVQKSANPRSVATRLKSRQAGGQSPQLLKRQVSRCETGTGTNRTFLVSELRLACHLQLLHSRLHVHLGAVNLPREQKQAQTPLCTRLHLPTPLSHCLLLLAACDAHRGVAAWPWVTGGRHDLANSAH